jgi:hypothetical protein
LCIVSQQASKWCVCNNNWGGKKAAVLHIADGMASEVRQVLHIRSVLGW